MESMKNYTAYDMPKTGVFRIDQYPEEKQIIGETNLLYVTHLIDVRQFAWTNGKLTEYTVQSPAGINKARLLHWSKFTQLNLFP